MQQCFRCSKCGASVAVGSTFCGNCGNQFNWGVQQPDQRVASSEQDSPSMHIVPLSYHSKEPVIYYLDGKLNLPAVTIDGRLSWLTAPDTLAQGLYARIDERYPVNRYNGVQSFVMCAVNIGQPGRRESVFIFEVWGFWEHFKEVDDLYNVLNALGNAKVGDSYWNQVLQYLANDPTRTWINTLIFFLKEQLNWTQYVHEALEYYESISE